MIETEGCTRCGTTFQEMVKHQNQWGEWDEGDEWWAIRCECGQKTLTHATFQEALYEWNVINQHIVTEVPAWVKRCFICWVITVLCIAWIVS